MTMDEDQAQAARDENLANFRRVMVDHLVDDLGQDPFIVSHIETGSLTHFLHTLLTEDPALAATYDNDYEDDTDD
jgi:hypothetical protein